MFESLPEPLKKVVEHFASLPGLGPKSAMRIALHLLEIPREKVQSFGRDVFELRDKLKICETCGAYCNNSPCEICSDPGRDASLLCVVPDWDGLMLIEKTKLFKGTYLVLGGLISPLDGKMSSNLRIELLKKRLSSGKIKEVILALGSTREAEMTESFLSDFISKGNFNVRITRLAQGIPVGCDLKYVDGETLKQSICYRQKL